MLAASLTAMTLTSLPAATLIYGFNSYAVDGKTVLYTSYSTGAANVGSANFSFDTTAKTEGTASLKMTGTYSYLQTSGYFGPSVAVGKLSANGTTQDFSSINTVISYDYMIENAAAFTSGTAVRVYLYEGGANGTGGTLVASSYQSAFSGNTSSSFLTLTTEVVKTNGTIGTGWTLNTGKTVADLANITYMRTVLAWGTTPTAANVALNYHIDNLQITGAGISIPEPSSVALLMGGLVLLGGIRGLRKAKRA